MDISYFLDPGWFIIFVLIPGLIVQISFDFIGGFARNRNSRNVNIPKVIQRFNLVTGVDRICINFVRIILFGCILYLLAFVLLSFKQDSYMGSIYQKDAIGMLTYPLSALVFFFLLVFKLNQGPQKALLFAVFFIATMVFFSVFSFFWFESIYSNRKSYLWCKRSSMRC